MRGGGSVPWELLKFHVYLFCQTNLVSYETVMHSDSETVRVSPYETVSSETAPSREVVCHIFSRKYGSKN